MSARAQASQGGRPAHKASLTGARTETSGHLSFGARSIGGQFALGGQTITGLVVAQHFLLQLAGNLEVKGFTGISGMGVQGHGSDLDM